MCWSGQAGFVFKKDRTAVPSMPLEMLCRRPLKRFIYESIAQNLCAHNKHRFYNSHCNRAHCTSHDSIKKKGSKNSPHLSVVSLTASLVVHLFLKTSESYGRPVKFQGISSPKHLELCITYIYIYIIIICMRKGPVCVLKILWSMYELTSMD